MKNDPFSEFLLQKKKERDALAKSKTSQLILNDLVAKTQEDEQVIKFVFELRKQLEIPEFGLSSNGPSAKKLHKGVCGLNHLTYVDVGEVTNRTGLGSGELLSLETSWFCRHYGFPGCGHILKHYVLFHCWPEASQPSALNVMDLNSRLERIIKENTETGLVPIDELKALVLITRKFPVSIMLNQNVSATEIKNFVDNCYFTHIEPRIRGKRKRRGSKRLVRHRKYENANRDIFIFNNRMKTANEIRTLVNENFDKQDLDETQINAIRRSLTKAWLKQ